MKTTTKVSQTYLQEWETTGSHQELSHTKNKEQEEVIVSVRHLSKKFCRNLKHSMMYGIIDLSKDLLGIPIDSTQLRKDEFWALDDVSFDLKKGETLGIIGVNGSGKSTLLRLITGIFPPDKGEIRVKGRVGALIAIGAGFHPHMTGYENIILNGIILGMTRKEINAKLDQIVEFADIGDFLDAPLSTYSSGMRVRLGFSIAIHVEPQILLVDEVLSVGDENFRKKCAKRIRNFLDNGGSVIFVSHSMLTVQHIADRVMWLDKSKVLMIGDTQETIAMYLMESAKRKNNTTGSESKIIRDEMSKVLAMSEEMTITTLYLLDKSGKPTNVIKVGDSMTICVEYEAHMNLKHPYFEFLIQRDNEPLARFNMYYDQYELAIKKGQGKILCSIKSLYLAPGYYDVVLAVMNEPGMSFGKKWIISRMRAASFGVKIESENRVSSHIGIWPPVFLLHTWSANKE